MINSAAEATVRPWNGAVAARPAVVIRCAEVGDVQAGLAFTYRLAGQESFSACRGRRPRSPGRPRRGG